MRYLILILPILLLSCGTDSEPEDVFEPYQIGTWLVTSPETADWIGENQQNKSKSDTLIVNNPGDHNMTIDRDTTQTKGAFSLVIIDSTVNTHTYENPTRIEGQFEDSGEFTFSLSQGGSHVSRNEDRMRAELGFFYQCGNGYIDPEYFHIVTRDLDDYTIIHSVIKVAVSGMKQTLDDTVC